MATSHKVGVRMGSSSSIECVGGSAWDDSLLSGKLIKTRQSHRVKQERTAAVMASLCKNAVSPRIPQPKRKLVSGKVSGYDAVFTKPFIVIEVISA